MPTPAGKFRALFLTAACSCSSMVLAEEESIQAVTEPMLSGFGLFVENDVLFKLRNEDRNYTMGVALQFGGRFVDDYQLNAPQKFVDGLFHTEDLHKKTAMGRIPILNSMQVGVTAFTPDDLADPDPIYDDRPYASLLYFLTRRQSIDAEQRHAFSSELSVGILGLQMAKSVQTWIHERKQDFPGDDPQTPMGWSHQVSDGGELTARYGFTAQRLVGPANRIFDFQVNGEGNLGYYCNFGVGAAFRLGKKFSPWWSFTAAPIKDSHKTFSPSLKGQAANYASQGKWELYGWASGGVKYWLYNALLQGQFRNSDVTVSSSDLKGLVGEYHFGVTGGVRFSNLWWNLTYSVAGRTAEFEGLNERSHYWGGVYLTASKSF